jgi:hypothetical protein
MNRHPLSFRAVKPKVDLIAAISKLLTNVYPHPSVSFMLILAKRGEDSKQVLFYLAQV